MIQQRQRSDFTSVKKKKRINTKPIDKVGKEFYNSFNKSFMIDRETKGMINMKVLARENHYLPESFRMCRCCS